MIVLMVLTFLLALSRSVLGYDTVQVLLCASEGEERLEYSLQRGPATQKQRHGSESPFLADRDRTSLRREADL